ncbi:MFS family transporter [Methylophilales bacterium HTCC2181]|uniref:MFS family transporter n=1 Tax=Methylophilales bacterium HTCC2181 TaxID=383631 RepID=A0P5C2_9PROT|nr:MFS family transporter [Methylophilales bacterium HTCC2181]
MSNREKMSSLEIRTSFILASIYALRMLGMFLILPIFAIYASGLEGNPTSFQIGLALGIYGLTQALFQIPFGMSSDYFGRKKVIYFGLLLFVIGSIVAALSSTIEGIIIGRSIQGAGAISAVLTALLADLTRDEHRTKAMAIIGGGIGLTFALSLVISPWLNTLIGVTGIFLLMAVLSVLAFFIVHFFIKEPRSEGKKTPITQADFLSLIKDIHLNRLNFGIFVLHATQISMFMIVPIYLISQGGIDLSSHWYIYLPVLIVSFLLIIPVIIFSERYHKNKLTFLGAILFLLAAQITFMVFSATLTGIIVALLIYFVGFNFLEASLPSLVSRVAPINKKGLALGVYNTSQSLGIFIGGSVGGLITKFYGYNGSFLFCIILIGVWFAFSCQMKVPLVKKN